MVLYRYSEGDVVCDGTSYVDSRSSTYNHYGMASTTMPKWTLAGNFHCHSVLYWMITSASVHFGMAITMHSTLFVDVYQPAKGGVI